MQKPRHSPAGLGFRELKASGIDGGPIPHHGLHCLDPWINIPHVSTNLQHLTLVLTARLTCTRHASACYLALNTFSTSRHNLSRWTTSTTTERSLSDRASFSLGLTQTAKQAHVLLGQPQSTKLWHAQQALQQVPAP